DVVVRAVRLEADVMAGALLPVGQLAPHERDLLPQVADDPRGAAGGQLDDGGDDLDDAAVEVDRAAGGELEGALLAAQHRRVDERRGAAPERPGVDLHPVEEDVEL